MQSSAFGCEKVTPFETYKQYLALKTHFSVDSFDFFKYNGKVNATTESYNKRNEKYHFERLAQLPDISKVLLAHVSENPDVWVGDISDRSDVYKNWQKRQSGLQYNFQESLKTFDIRESIQTTGEHPILLKLYLRNQISKENMIILNTIIRYGPQWDKVIQDDLIWPKIKFNLKKYSPFLKFDSTKYKVLLDNHIRNTFIR